MKYSFIFFICMFFMIVSVLSKDSRIKKYLNLACDGYLVNASRALNKVVNNSDRFKKLDNVDQAKVYHAGCGVSTSALAFGGQSSSQIAKNEAWNGSAWTEVNDLNTARHQLGHSGTSTLALAFGGAPIPAAAGKTEDWNGASWSEVADMSTARGYPASSGSSTAALATGGTIPPGASSTATEEWSGSSDIIKVLTD